MLFTKWLVEIAFVISHPVDDRMRNAGISTTTRMLAFSLALLVASDLRADCVVLLHGLTRTSASMETLADAFSEAGYAVANIDYPSTQFPIETLAPAAIEKGIAACPPDSTVHFVTHSLGGILVRHYLAHNEFSRLGKVVMIAPPNQGSGVVAAMHDVPGFEWYNGPAGMQLGIDDNSIPLQLPAVTYPVGVIAGTRTFNVILSQFLANPDDGKVSVENTKVAGMTDFIEVPYSHPFIMKRKAVVELTLQFISSGSFKLTENSQ
ncbi:MAG: alpha/beta fold hydrolase [Pseudomonadota bacterium]